MYGMKENVKESTIDIDTPSISKELSIRRLSSSAFRFNVFDVSLEEKIDPRYSYFVPQAGVAGHCVCVQKVLVRKRSYRLLSSCKSSRKLFVLSHFL